jgi:sulfate adenylyltransferase
MEGPVGEAALVLSERAASDVELIGVGAYRPLGGFMTEADYRSVLRDMRLADGQVWTLPVTLAVTTAEAARWRVGDELPLADPEGRLLAVLSLEDKFRYDREEEARLVYGTTDPAHPGVAALFAQGEVLLGGRVRLVARRPPRFPAYALDPADTRALFRARGWRTVVGFQTRNPIHRAHEYLIKVAAELVDGVLIHPLVGETKADDVPAEVRMRCYEAMLEHYFPRDRVVLAVLPAAMRYAGPREAVFHALVRRNYGCTHFIVGRDHAGVGRYYGPYDGQRIFERFAPEELGIRPIFLEHAFYCRRCAGMATRKTCPHDEAAHVVLSGTAVRAKLAAGEAPPPEYTRPEVAAVLVETLRASGAPREAACLTGGADGHGAAPLGPHAAVPDDAPNPGCAA